MFEFDKVFDQPATQEEVFNEVAVPLVEVSLAPFFPGYMIGSITIPKQCSPLRGVS